MKLLLLFSIYRNSRKISLQISPILLSQIALFFRFWSTLQHINYTTWVDLYEVCTELSFQTSSKNLSMNFLFPLHPAAEHNVRFLAILALIIVK